MKRLQILNYSFLGLFLTLMTSCNNEPVSTESSTSAREKDYYLKLGQKLENLYTRTLDADKRNPYLLDSENKSHDFIYTLTPEDYANANPK